jgi:hypothetical protein
MMIFVILHHITLAVDKTLLNDTSAAWNSNQVIKFQVLFGSRQRFMCDFPFRMPDILNAFLRSFSHPSAEGEIDLQKATAASFQFLPIHHSLQPQGRVTVQAVSHRPLIAKAGVLSQASPYGICGRQNGNGTGFLLVLWFSLVIHIPPMLLVIHPSPTPYEQLRASLNNTLQR